MSNPEQNPSQKRQYYFSLPRKRSATGVLLFRDGNVLVVKPSYRPEWLVPGGIVESFESPLEAAVRECQEEIGTVPLIKRLLVVDYKKGDAEIGDAIHFLFEAELNGESQIAIDGNEITDYRWEPVETAAKLFGPHLSKRFVAALASIDRSSTVFCHDGEIIC